MFRGILWSVFALVLLSGTCFGLTQKEAEDYGVTVPWRDLTELDKREIEEGIKRQKQKNTFEKQVKVLVDKYGATDMSGDKMATFIKNPFAYKDKNLLISGTYKQNLSKTEAILAYRSVEMYAAGGRVHARPSDNFIQLDTSRNFAEVSGLLRCVVKVLGTTKIKQDGVPIEIPHTKEIECLTSP